MLRLFSVNGFVGRGARGASDFPGAADFVSHLDYLGVERAVVWHVAARDMNPFYGNRTLLEELAAMPRASARRLLPAFVIAPTDFYESGVSDFYKEKLASGEVRALRIFPGTCRFALRQIERVLRELAPYRPVVLWDLRDSAHPTDARDFVRLARDFPDLAFICTQMMWGEYGTFLDMMWRSDNILADTSWLHVRSSIELLVKHFGAGRVVFGIGPKAHYGAAVAALVHAQISEQDRDRIAHGNIERLLDIPQETATVGSPALPDEKPLWRRFRSGKAIEGVEVIDAHAHTGPASRGWYLQDNTLERDIPNLLRCMDRLGVNRLIVSAIPAISSDPVEGNRRTEKFLTPHKDRFLGYLLYNPHYERDMVPILDEFFSRGFFVGFKIWHLPLDDPQHEVVWKYADRYALPVLMHTWNGAMSSPGLLADIIGNYANATFIIGHSGGGDSGRREAEELALAHPNVMLDFCGSFTSSIPWEETIRKVGNTRVVFGSDTCVHDLAWELGRCLSTPLPDDELAPILGENMKKVLARSELGRLRRKGT